MIVLFVIMFMLLFVTSLYILYVLQRIEYRLEHIEMTKDSFEYLEQTIEEANNIIGKSYKEYNKTDPNSFKEDIKESGFHRMYIDEED